MIGLIAQVGLGAAMSFVRPSEVVVSDAFWTPRYQLWRTKTIPDVMTKFDERSRVSNNFKLAGEDAKEGHYGCYFFDGLANEVIRGVSDYLSVKRDAELEQRVDRLVGLIVAAQRKDGYLNTRVQITEPQHRWGDNGGFGLEQHELYNAGCLIEAGVHYYQATGKTALLGAGLRFANLLCDLFGPAPKRNLIPAHSLTEEALVKLAWIVRSDSTIGEKTGVPMRPDDYVALVKFWLDNHGNNCGEPDVEALGIGKYGEAVRKLTAVPHDPSWRPSLGDYMMDRRPLSEYTSIEGHAVRATLLACGLATYAIESGSAEHALIASRLWDSMVGRKMYISGGVGAEPSLERFVADYQLPPNAYLETCAAIGSAFFSARMAELTGDARYIDEIERVAYNALLTSVGADGCTYTYVNPLNTEKGERWEWNYCPCCPPMFLKMTGALPGYAYAQDAEGCRVNLFMAGETTFGGKWGGVRLVQKTAYPEAGPIEVVVHPGAKTDFALRVRIPGWARGVENPYGLYTSAPIRPWELKVNGERQNMRLEGGYAVLRRTWRDGDSVTLSFDFSERTIRAADQVAEVKGRVARMRGPILMASEKGVWMPYYNVANHGAVPHEVWVEK